MEVLNGENFIDSVSPTLFSDMATSKNFVVANKIMKNDSSSSFYKKVTLPLLTAFRKYKKYSIEEIEIPLSITKYEIVGDSARWKQYSNSLSREIVKPRNYELSTYRVTWTVVEHSNGGCDLGFNVDVEDLGDRVKVVLYYNWAKINKADESILLYLKLRLLYEVLI